jgi:hypothetical protein
MSLTKLSLGGNYDVINKLFLRRLSFLSDIPSGDGNIEKLFLRCGLHNAHTIARNKRIEEIREQASSLFCDEDKSCLCA